MTVTCAVKWLPGKKGVGYILNVVTETKQTMQKPILSDNIYAGLEVLKDICVKEKIGEKKPLIYIPNKTGLFGK